MDRTIYINKRFDLKYDDMGDKWIVEKSISKKGNENAKVYCGYHWHFKTLLNAFCKKRLPEQDATSVKGALKALTEVEHEIQTLTEQLGKELDDKWQSRKNA